MNSRDLHVTLDAAPSARSFDENGFLHVASSHITKATVNPYYGREIPGWREAGLDPDRVYHGLRDAEELRKSVPTWEGLPLHIEHHIDSAEEPEKLTRVGAVGAAAWNAPYIDAPLTVWDRAAIDAIEDGAFRELSCAYRYDPDFTPGTHEGVAYDFVMRNIRGNHVALVEEGRAGPDVVVADAAFEENDHPRDKDGKFSKGAGGSGGKKDEKKGVQNPSTPLESTDPDTARYQALIREQGGDHKKAAHEYFREKLQGRHVEAQTDEGPINACFTGASWKEIKKNMGDDPDKAALVPHMPDIIAHGEHEARPPDHYHPEVSRFHIYRKTVETNKGPREGIVDVAERPIRSPEHLVYNLIGEGSREYTNRRQKESASSGVLRGYYPREPETPTRDSLAVDGETLAPLFEVVNLRFEEGRHMDGQREKISPDSGLEQNPRLSGDVAETANALNIRIIPFDVNPSPIRERNGKPAGSPAQKAAQGGIMSTFRKWFRGAKDASPETEQQEVDLAQAIIDLHRVDPATGEIVDITEDEDKAAEIRKLVGEFAGKLEPEEVKRLTDALAGLAYAKATGDANPADKGAGAGNGAGKSPALDADTLRAMDRCGLDAENPAEQHAFAEGVDYGERLMRDPDERKRLDSEHESEGMRRVMGEHGLDAESPVEQRAFAEGVKYGEEKGQGEGPAATDEAPDVEKIVAAVPGLSEEQAKKLREALAALAAPAAADEDPKAAAAQDSALRRRSPGAPRPSRAPSRAQAPASAPALATAPAPAPSHALDSARTRAATVAETHEHFRSLSRAVRDVRPLVGELDPMAFDSASAVYGYALEQNGVRTRDYPRSSWRGMVDMLRRQQAPAPGAGMARDRAPVARMEGSFAGLNTISLAD